MRTVAYSEWTQYDRAWAVAFVATIPACDWDNCEVPAIVDGSTARGWAYLCPLHFVQHGQGLGLGLGQVLALSVESVEQAVLLEGVRCDLCNDGTHWTECTHL